MLLSLLSASQLKFLPGTSTCICVDICDSPGYKDSKAQFDLGTVGTDFFLIYRFFNF